jgi:hypothetical protein
MWPMKKKFRVVVQPGLIQQEKWGVYILATEQPNFEMLDACGIDTKEKAIEIAEHISEKYPTDLIFDKGVKVIESAPQPKGEFEQITADEETLIGYLEDYLEEMFKQVNQYRPSQIKIDPKEWLKALFTNPFPIALIGILVYFFSFEISAPDWIEPILPDQLTSSAQLILAIPILVLVFTIISVFQRRSISCEMSVLRSYLLALVFKYKWRLMEIAKLFMKVAGKIENSEISQTVGQLHDKDPDAYKNIMPSESESKTPTIIKESRELYETLQKNDFERRVHALLFFEKEARYSPTKIRFNPYNFLLSYESRSLQFQVIKQVLGAGGTVANVSRKYRQRALFETLMYYVGATVTFLVINGLIGFALFLGIREASTLSLVWTLFTGICAFFSLAIPIKNFYQVFLKGQGWPRGFYIWEVGSVN